MSSPYYNIEPEIIFDVAVDSETTALTADDKQIVDPLGSGFVWYTPPLASPTKDHEMHCNRDWNIAGHDMQVLTMTLPPNESVITEVGSFMFGSADIQTNVELTCFSGEECFQRVCGGESCVKLIMTNSGPNPGVIICLHNANAPIVPSLTFPLFVCLLFLWAVCWLDAQLSRQNHSSQIWETHRCK